MKKYLFILSGLTLLFAGCAKVENEENVLEEEPHYVTLKATIADRTRVTADADGYYAWQKDEEITVLVIGPDGETPKPFRATESGTTTDFMSVFPVMGDTPLGRYAFSPSTFAECGVTPWDETIIKFGLDAAHMYVKDATFMPMLGTITPTGASFKAVGGALKLTINNVPSNAFSLQFTVHGQRITGSFILDLDENGKPEKIVTEGQDGDDSVIIGFPGQRENNMEFYIPLPTGVYNGFSLGFLNSEDESIGTKSTNATLNVGINDLIIAPTLDWGQSSPAAPNIHDYITFSEETLMYFPELASDHPVIRIPRKEFDMSFEWYRFSYSDDIPSVELDGGNGAYGAHFVDDDNPNASWEDTWLFVGWNSSRGMCIYPRSMSNWLRSGKMVFSTNEIYQGGYPTFEVPVEEYYVPTLKKNGIPVHNNESLMMYPGEAPAVITVEIPKWMTVESHSWTIYDQDGIASFSDETDDSDEYYTRYSRTVSIDPTLPYGSCRVVFNSYLSYEHMTSVGIQQMGYSVDCGINIFPFHIYDQNDNNLTNSYLYLNRGDRLILEPRFYGISADQIEDVMWYDDSGWYEVPGTDEWEYDPERSILNLSYNSAAPYKAEITVKDNAEGEGHVSCWVKLVGEEDYNWDVSLSIYLKNSSATVSHAPSVPKYTATKNRHLRKHSPLILK